jgi:dTDP-4-amino-4,6-dideoxygalactose transaminase
MGSELIPFTRVVITSDAQAAAQRSLASGWLTTGPECAAFEEEFASWLGARDAVGVSSCTAALELCLRALRLPAGAGVLVPAITFCGAVNAVLHAGLVPVLADVDPVTGTMSPATARSASLAAGGVQALMVLHYAGSPAPVHELADAVGVPLGRVVEDAAHAVGTFDDDGRVGSGSRAACFSFYATKNLPIGEGGMVATDDDDLADRLRSARLHGMSRDAWRRYEPGGSWRYDVAEPGLKANLSDVAAAVGRVQLSHVDEWQDQRTALAAAYRAELDDVAGLDLPEDPAAGRHGWHLFVVRVNAWAKVTRDELSERLALEGVGTSVHFIPLHHLTCYRGGVAMPVPLAGADVVFPRLLSLPMYPSLTRDEVSRVCSVIKQSLSSSQRRKVNA